MSFRLATLLPITFLLLLLVCSALTQTDSTETAGGTSANECPTGEGEQQDHLEEIKARGYLRCGVKNEPDPVFGFATKPIQINEANYSNAKGFDVDLCKAVAVAIFQVPKLQLVGVDTVSRFEALRNGTIDVLSRTTTNTLTRRTKEKVFFAPTTFYSGQGFAVANDSNVQTLADLDITGNLVCVVRGTTAAANTPRLLHRARVFVASSEQQALNFLVGGQCIAYSDDKSTLASGLARTQGFEGTILARTFSKEPLAMGTYSAPQYRNLQLLIEAISNGLFNADEGHITSDNVYRQQQNPSLPPRVQKMLGFDPQQNRAPFDTGLPLPSTFMANVIAQLGNYGEIYQRNVEPTIPREGSLNELYTNEGLLYGTPWE